MTEHYPKCTESVTHRYYCDECKEGTPHIETSPGVWQCSIPHPGNDGRKPNPPKEPTLDFGDYSDDARSFAALDGMGGRGNPPPIQLRRPKGEQ